MEQFPESVCFIDREGKGTRVNETMLGCCSGAIKRGFVSLMFTGLLAGVLVFAGASSALAAFPGAAFSHYVQDSSGVGAPTWNTRGCAEANAQKAGTDPVNAVVVLDFGYEWNNGSSYGSTDFAGAFLSEDKIETVIKAYGDGYYGCSAPSIHLNLAIGTKNDVTTYLTTTAGTHWGNMINHIDTYLGGGAGNGCGGCDETSRIIVTAAGDFELDWSKPSPPNNWLGGYTTAGTHTFFDFGDAAGCPQTTHTNGSCDNGWNQSDVLSVSWQSGTTHKVFPLPEIYNTLGHQADQWEQIDLYAVTLPRGAISMRGSMTQRKACSQSPPCNGTDNTASQGWNQLQNALNSQTSTSQGLGWSTDIMWGF